MFSLPRRNRVPSGAASVPAKSDAREPIIAVLLMDSLTFDVAAAKSAIIAAPIAGQSPFDLRIDDDVISFGLSDETLFIAPMPAPYPWAELRPTCETSWMWPREKPAMSVKAQKSHVLLTSMGGSANPVARRVPLTHVLGRLALLPGVLGVFYPEATLVHYPPIFAEMAKLASDKTPPFYLWVDFRLFKTKEGSTGCFTTGLAKLGLMEMEVTGVSMGPQELRDWVVNIAGYLFTRGGPIAHGDTIGVSASHQLKVSHGPSHFGAPGQVMRFGSTT